MSTKRIYALRAIFAFLCFGFLIGQLWSISKWSEDRGVYDDVCYLRQAHLFQRFGVAGFDTEIARDDDDYFKSKLRAINFPAWNTPEAAPCHNRMPATGKLVIQYPPGVGIVLALFPPGHQVAPMYMLATIIVFGFGLLAIFAASEATSILIAGVFGCLTIYMMNNPVKASYSVAPTVAVCAIAGFLTARWLTSSRYESKIGLIIPLGFLLGFTVNFRVANLFLASGYFLFLLSAFLTVPRKAQPFLQGASFAAAFVFAMMPTLVSYAINSGSPFASTYGNNPDVRPLDFSFGVVRDYMADPLQIGLLALGIGFSIFLLRRQKGVRRVALLTLSNLAINLAFFFTYPIFTPYYLIPIALLSLWSVLFAVLMEKSEIDDLSPFAWATNGKQ
jgi:hypothetical protein